MDDVNRRGPTVFSDSSAGILNLALMSTEVAACCRCDWVVVLVVDSMSQPVVGRTRGSGGRPGYGYGGPAVSTIRGQPRAGHGSRPGHLEGQTITT